MGCRQFILRLEEYLDSHPGMQPALAPPRLRQHAESCDACARRWREALASRTLLGGLATDGAGNCDAAFIAGVWSRIQAARNQAATWHGLAVARRDLAAAFAMLVITLGALVYNLSTPLRPDASEAMVLDVPHWHAQHPLRDHARPTDVDAMLSLMNP